MAAIALLVTGLATVSASQPTLPDQAPAPTTQSPTPSPVKANEIEPDPLVEEMLALVNQGTLRQYEEWLTGEEPALVGGEPFVIATRYTFSDTHIQKATQFAFEHLETLGLETEYHQWESPSYPNVIATQVGLTDPDTTYVISAHLDDLPRGQIAPGADDNASGSAAVLAAADILSQYQFGCTLKFALWTAEEQGMRGSGAWAKWAALQGMDIRGVLNMDMIAYDSDDHPEVDLHARREITGSVPMANTFAAVVDAYDVDLLPEILVNEPLGTRSDNRSFWDEGYPAILATEDGEDFNPNYHTVNDTLSALDLAYMTEVVKASVATLVHTSDCLLPAGVGHLDGYVTEASSEGQGTRDPIAGAAVSMHNDAGQIYQAVTDHTGYYTRTLPVGTYTISAAAPGRLPAIRPGVAVLPAKVTTQNFELEIMPPIGMHLFLPIALQLE
jgi:hypothetical protein